MPHACTEDPLVEQPATRLFAEFGWTGVSALGELFGRSRGDETHSSPAESQSLLTSSPTITKHLGNIFESGELVETSVISILEHTAADGKTYSAKYYNLDAIIAVGYRVNSSYHAVEKLPNARSRRRKEADYLKMQNRFYEMAASITNPRCFAA